MAKKTRIPFVTAVVLTVCMIYMLGGLTAAIGSGVSGAAILLFGHLTLPEIMEVFNVLSMLTVVAWVIWAFLFVVEEKKS
ncbi:hypothetical protein [Texcoconibacillus texcoconensis]|uniref:Putative membrane protein YccC n=1 Tax=Texcoconibacillus texcoconensis TaxID=1095777 RepID=A0A840QR38_9BACI|nr:hypothetical protein [Texcoconibacillus texcoconensis]MBB5173819.1 putative membrane protein YccC [Texcoconibacillus texcoconensis]